MLDLCASKCQTGSITNFLIEEMGKYTVLELVYVVFKLSATSLKSFQ